MIVSGVATIGFIALLTAMRSKRVLVPNQIYKALLLLAICAATLIPISQLATAMVVVRESHRSADAAKMVSATIDILMKPELIEVQRKKDQLAALSSSYDETYIENPVLSRFVLTKFHDNALFFESKLTERTQDELANTTIDLFWSILPDPVLKYFDIRVVKSQLQFSLGDYLYYQATGGGLGGYRVGSIFGHGIGLFGWAFTIIYFWICLLSFWIMDFLAKKNEKGNVIISVVGVLLIWRLYLYGINAESINNTIGFFFREIPQSILIFFIAYQIARVVTRPFALFGQLQLGKTYSGKAK